MNRTSALGDGAGFGMRVLGVLAICALLIFSGSCIVRSGPSATEVARSGRGVQVTVTAKDDVLTGEVLGADEDGLLILDSKIGLVNLHWSTVRNLETHDYDFRWPRGSWPELEQIEELSQLSRFPPGLSESQIDELLSFHGPAEVLMIGYPVPAGAAPGTDVESSDLVRRARKAARRFKTLDEAMLNGYVPVGPDFPGMGRHWVNAFVLMRDGTDPGRPPFLTYVETPNGTKLTGVALGRVGLPGEDAVALPLPEAWHDHAGTIDEELLALNPDASHHMGGEDGPRLSMLHVWTEVDNPAGVLAQDNWAIPFHRLGLLPNGPPTPHQGKALFLASGGDDYYLRLIARLVHLGPAEETAVRAALADQRAVVQRMIDRDDLAKLEDVWSSLWGRIRRSVSPKEWQAIHVLAR